MKNFMSHNFTIAEITFANVVKAGTSAKIHKNRKSHGLAIFLGGERTFYFDNKVVYLQNKIHCYNNYNILNNNTM